MAITLTDPQVAPTYADSAFQRWAVQSIYDPRDVVFLRLVGLVFAVMIPIWVIAFTAFTWWLIPVYACAMAYFSPRVTLMLHCIMHRPLFRRYRWFNQAILYSMSFFFGIPTGYAEHHIGMHHVENNTGEDLSATTKYQRDSFWHFTRYFTRFFFLSVIEVPLYLHRHPRGPMMARALISNFVHWGLIALFWQFNWQATVVVMMLPYFVSHFAMISGNWGQHAFVDQNEPGNSYKNSITCINAGYNKTSFNDGYHIGHHVKANRHWTELPKDFLDSLPKYIEQECIVFEGLDFFMVSALLWMGRYDVLARRFVRLDGKERSDADVIAFLKSRTRPLPTVTASLPTSAAAA